MKYQVSPSWPHRSSVTCVPTSPVVLSTHAMFTRRDSIELILSNGLTLGVLVAIFLHLVLPYHEEDDSLTVVIDGDEKPAKEVDISASDEESLDGKVCAGLPLARRHV